MADQAATPSVTGAGAPAYPLRSRPGEPLQHTAGAGREGAGGATVKEMHVQPVGEAGDERWERARREALAVARMAHPHVIGIYDLVHEDDRVWMVTEYVDGPSLAEHVSHAGPLDVARVAEIGVQLLDALDAVHTAGALHRDVKPANVLMRPDGRVVLRDFGIATMAGSESLTVPGGSLDRWNTSHRSA